jgi:hypothetical protein
MMKWKLKDLEPLIIHAVEATEHCQTYSQQFAGIENPPPALQLVHDSGIYLMSNGNPNLPRPDGKEGSLVIYAQGFDPDKDGEDVWHNARAEVGGDDFVQGIPMEFVLNALKDIRRYLYITFTETDFSMKATGNRKDTIKLPDENKKPAPKQTVDTLPVDQTASLIDSMLED